MLKQPLQLLKPRTAQQQDQKNQQLKQLLGQKHQQLDQQLDQLKQQLKQQLDQLLDQKHQQLDQQLDRLKQQLDQLPDQRQPGQPSHQAARTVAVKAQTLHRSRLHDESRTHALLNTSTPS